MALKTALKKKNISIHLHSTYWIKKVQSVRFSRSGGLRRVPRLVCGERTGASFVSRHIELKALHKNVLFSEGNFE